MTDDDAAKTEYVVVGVLPLDKKVKCGSRKCNSSYGLFLSADKKDANAYRSGEEVELWTECFKHASEWSHGEVFPPIGDHGRPGIDMKNLAALVKAPRPKWINSDFRNIYDHQMGALMTGQACMCGRDCPYSDEYEGPRPNDGVHQATAVKLDCCGFVVHGDCFAKMIESRESPRYSNSFGLTVVCPFCSESIRKIDLVSYNHRGYRLPEGGNAKSIFDESKENGSLKALEGLDFPDIKNEDEKNVEGYANVSNGRFTIASVLQGCNLEGFQEEFRMKLPPNWPEKEQQGQHGASGWPKRRGVLPSSTTTRKYLIPNPNGAGYIEEGTREPFVFVADSGETRLEDMRIGEGLAHLPCPKKDEENKKVPHNAIIVEAEADCHKCPKDHVCGAITLYSMVTDVLFSYHPPLLNNHSLGDDAGKASGANDAGDGCPPGPRTHVAEAGTGSQVHTSNVEDELDGIQPKPVASKKRQKKGQGGAMRRRIQGETDSFTQRNEVCNCCIVQVTISGVYVAYDYPHRWQRPMGGAHQATEGNHSIRAIKKHQPLHDHVFQTSTILPKEHLCFEVSREIPEGYANKLELICEHLVLYVVVNSYYLMRKDPTQRAPLEDDTPRTQITTLIRAWLVMIRDDSVRKALTNSLREARNGTQTFGFVRELSKEEYEVWRKDGVGVKQVIERAGAIVEDMHDRASKLDEAKLCDDNNTHHYKLRDSLLSLVDNSRHPVEVRQLHRENIQSLQPPETPKMNRAAAAEMVDSVVMGAFKENLDCCKEGPKRVDYLVESAKRLSKTVQCYVISFPMIAGLDQKDTAKSIDDFVKEAKQVKQENKKIKLEKEEEKKEWEEMSELSSNEEEEKKEDESAIVGE